MLLYDITPTRIFMYLSLSRDDFSQQATLGNITYSG